MDTFFFKCDENICAVLCINKIELSIGITRTFKIGFKKYMTEHNTKTSLPKSYTIMFMNKFSLYSKKQSYNHDFQVYNV